MEFLPRLKPSDLEPTDALLGTTDIRVGPSLGAQQKVFIRGPSSTARPSVGSTPSPFTFFPNWHIGAHAESDGFIQHGWKLLNRQSCGCLEMCRPDPAPDG